jgi:hypothetical protein
MKSTVLWALVVLNALLLLGFLSRLTPSNAAMAQAPRRPGEYIMVPGETVGSGGVVYVVDTTNGLLSAIAWDESQRKLVSMPKLPLADIFTRGADAVNPPGGNRRGR